MWRSRMQQQFQRRVKEVRKLGKNRTFKVRLPTTTWWPGMEVEAKNTEQLPNALAEWAAIKFQSEQFDSEQANTYLQGLECVARNARLNGTCRRGQL